jgi:putative transposase
MNFVLQPLQRLLVILAGWSNRRQQEVIEYLRTENQILNEKLGKRRILLTDDQRRRLACKGKVLGRKVLESVGTLFTPIAILRWHRLLVAQKWDYSDRAKKKPGRPPIPDEFRALVLRLASENPTWGYDRIQGALANLGLSIADATVSNILKGHGIEPAPDRKRQTSWQTFLQAHWDVLAAVDFTTVEVWTKNGLVTVYLLFVMELATRRVHFAGSTANPEEAWMKQVARNLTVAEDGFLNGKRHVCSWIATPSSARLFATAPKAGRPVGSAAAAFPQLQRPFGAVYAQPQGRISGPHNLLRRGVVAPGGWPVPGALSRRTQPPRLGQSPHQRGRRGRAFHRPSALSAAPRRRLALLPQTGRLTPFLTPGLPNRLGTRLSGRARSPLAVVRPSLYDGFPAAPLQPKSFTYASRKYTSFILLVCVRVF